MAQRISTNLGQVFYEAPRASVATSATLGGVFVERPGLNVDSLRVAIAPEVGQANLSFDYGDILDERGGLFAPVAPLELLGLFCKVIIPDTVGNDDLVWFGIIEADDEMVAGTHEGTTPTGRQRFTAYGLLRLFERTRVTSAIVRDLDPDNPNADDVLEIGRGLAFNRDQAGRFMLRGNRSADKHTTEGGDESYVFAADPWDPAGTPWNAWEALQYLAVHHRPADEAGEAICDVAVSGAADSISWYQIGLDTEGRTVKELLDGLISRRRGVGYRVLFAEAFNRLVIDVFTFAARDVALPSGATLAANADQYELDFEAAFDIAQAIVSNLAITHYDVVEARGEFRTSTVTLRIADPADLPVGLSSEQLIPAWSAEQESQYLEAASQTEGYGDHDLAGRCALNAATRASGELAAVYARFGISSNWDGKVTDAGRLETGFIYASPRFDAAGAAITTGGVEAESFPIWKPGIRLERFLPLRDGLDYSGDRIGAGTFNDEAPDVGRGEFLRPFAFVNDDARLDVDDYWLEADRLAANVGHEDAGRQWAADLDLLDAGPQLQLVVNGGPQHMLAPEEMTPVEYSSTSTSIGNVGVSGDGYVGAYAPEDDPAIYGLSWREFWATLCLRLDERLSAEAWINAPPAGRMARRLVIDVPDARRDYVAPYTVVGCPLGGLAQSTSGGFVRDDMAWLEDIARAAAQWYGTERQALRLRWKQCRKLVEPGWLITSIGNNYSREGINSIVSAVTYSLTPGGMATEIETSFVDLDFL